MTPQPSPTNLSDELKRILFDLVADAIMAAALHTGDTGVDKAIEAITAAYAEAIRSAVPEKRKLGTYKAAMRNHEVTRYYENYAWNSAIDTMLDNLKKKGLLPANASDEGGVK